MEPSTAQAYDACLREALAQMGEWIPRWLKDVQDLLYQKEGAASQLREKQGWMEARTALESQRQFLSTRILETLAESVGNALPELAPPSRKLDGLSFGELELMGDDQVQEKVEEARVLQVIKIAADDDLVDLNARMCRAKGHAQVRPELNPLRSEIVTRALIKAINGIHAPAAVRNTWLQTGALLLGKELAAMYVRLGRLMDTWGVAPADYRVVTLNESRSPAVSPSQRDERAVEAVTPGAATGSQAPVLNLDQLHKLLVGNLEQQGAGPAGTGLPGSGNAMVRNLAAEVVTLMLKSIAEDQRLLPPIRSLLLDMKPALLQLASSEPRFFADRQNPARRLLDAITERSLAFSSEYSGGYGKFADEVHEIQRALEVPGADLPERFERLLARFIASQVTALPPSQILARGKAVKTLVRVEQRNLLAERVAAEFQARNDFESAPGVVRRFVEGPWAQVVAQARIDAADMDAGSPTDSPAVRYVHILPDLLWSTHLGTASQNRPRLIRVIPNILRTLREGLDSIDYPRADTETFFKALMGLHEAAYKAQRTDLASEGPASVRRQEATQTWMQPTEAKDSGFMEDMELDTQPAFVNTEPMARDPREMDALEPLLPVGTWVDVAQEGEALRCQLDWASPHGTMFLFSTAQGRQLSMSRRTLERQLLQSKVRVVADHGLVDDALDKVTRQAWINSVKVAEAGETEPGTL
ncbi:MAG TPA: DUF1631 family protein [Hydrogenophaga sp.]|uniref:DUF1631 family protein n=1 Tax=Hydrogenophaga sp. TaxID=1904254 RepID=UPI002BCE6496|nr:DUF1631 family protein [Hydrogenophaga sp.]HMN94619.1 DUF1631 family protein [Hydrogenophaga sp.]HMP09709.1 DUF1631 family protein [Hydrogenophaga sp.]